ncbi:MAG: MarR family transcriptional regulator [Agathobacter sp.]|nr:MarR family transcriptional regulator [Agathobacter sp.]
MQNKEEQDKQISNEKMHKNIGHKVRIIHNYIDKYFHTSWEKAGIEPTRMQCATLHYLRHHKGEDVFQKDLEAAFSISGATVTNILKVMEKDGLITRVQMEKDARLKKLEMTEKGMQYDEVARTNVIRLEEGMEKGFTEEELTRFREYLERLTQNIVDLVDENTK